MSSQNQLFNIKAFILKKIKYNDADLIVHCLTQTGERLTMLARSALKSKKRFGGGVLEPTHYVQINFKRGRTDGSLLSLEEASLLKDFSGIRKSYDKIELALFMVDVINRIALEGDDNSQSIFNLLGHSLSTLEGISVSGVDQLAGVNQLEKLKILFVLKILHQQGVLIFEDWMRLFLEHKITELEQFEVDMTKLRVESKLTLYQMEQYLKTAENY